MTVGGALLYLLGACGFILGLGLSIALHELGHMSVAKRFRVKVTDFSVGFGPTLWSRFGRETVYNLRAVPLGGYIKMIGMFPPTSRHGHAEYMNLAPSERGRTFFAISAPRKAAIMLAGPLMNLLIATTLVLVAVVGVGVPQPTNKIGGVFTCAGAAESCAAESPAYRAGIKPGDRLVSVAGVPVADWYQLRDAISAAEGPVPVVLERSGGRVGLVVDVERVGGVGRIGISPATELVTGSTSEALDWVWATSTRVLRAVVTFPAKTFELARALVTGDARDESGPVSVVGLTRFSGEVASADAPVSWRVVDLLILLAGLNLSLFVFNLIPLLPLDGGHVLTAAVEGARRNLARIRGGVDPGPVDSTKLLPLTYLVAAFLLSSAVVVMLADLIRPIQVG